MVSVLLVQTAFDKPTSIQAMFFNNILKYAVREAKLRGYNIKVLYGPSVTSENFKDAVIKYDPQFIYFGGHGQETRLMGQFLDTLILYGYNDYLLEGRIVYSFACDSASLLGKYSKARAYLGYREDFVVPRDDRYMLDFMAVGFYPLREVLSGSTVYEAYVKTKKLYEAKLRKIRDFGVRMLVIHNANAFVLYGDKTARIS